MTSCISTDGSSFDSTQLHRLKTRVENPIYELFMDHVEKIFNDGPFFKAMAPEDKRRYLDNLRQAYLRHDYDLVVDAPGIDTGHRLTAR